MQQYEKMVGLQAGQGSLTATELSNRLDQKAERRLDVLTAQANSLRDLTAGVAKRVGDLRARLLGGRPLEEGKENPNLAPCANCPLDEAQNILRETRAILDAIVSDLDALATL